MILYSYYIIKFVKFVMKYDHDRMEKELRNELEVTDEKGWRDIVREYYLAMHDLQ